MKQRAFFMIAIAVLAAALVSCSQSSTATVTIDTGLGRRDSYRSVSFIDRIIAFLSLGSEAQADPPSVSVDYITLTISGPDMDTMEATISRDTGVITLEVEAGESRRFTVETYLDDGYGVMLKEYGGISTVDLSPGEFKTITIQMGNLPDQPVINQFGSGTGPDYLQPRWNPVPYVVGYHLYRSEVGDQGPFTRIATIPEDMINSFTDYNLLPGAMYWYKVSGYNQYGEGRISDPTFLETLGY
jgi:hypothetical protein